jgi:enamine deaminase RidA (YjgF/YER057c/UK114 family)
MVERIETDRRRSRAVKHAGFVFISGQVADNREDDIAGQTKQVLDKLEKYLQLAGSDKEHIISVQIYLQNLDRDYQTMNALWDEWVPAGTAPTRITMEVKLAAPNILIELTATATERA